MAISNIHEKRGKKLNNRRSERKIPSSFCLQKFQDTRNSWYPKMQICKKYKLSLYVCVRTNCFCVEYGRRTQLESDGRCQKAKLFFVGEKHIRCEMHLFFPFSGKMGLKTLHWDGRGKWSLKGNAFFGNIVSNLFANGAKRGICTSSQLQKETMNIPSNLGRKDTDKRHELKMRKHCVVFFGTCDIIHFPESVYFCVVV